MPRPKKTPKLDLAEALRLMVADYTSNPTKAVRSQSFIKILHRHLAEELDSRLTPWARKSRGVYRPIGGIATGRSTSGQSTGATELLMA